MNGTNQTFYKNLEEKAKEVRKSTLLVHKFAPGTRISSSLSAVEIITVLFFGNILKFKPSDPLWNGRDRFIVSKGHGSIAMYPVLAELGFINPLNLLYTCSDGAMLGSIPDPTIPGYETVNGSLGHGLGISCGIALALKSQNRTERVYCLMGDGELYEGSVWEALRFAGLMKLDNLTLIIDANGHSMLGRCDFMDCLRPIQLFGWGVDWICGHSVASIHKSLSTRELNDRPKLIYAYTVKGKGVPELESDPMSHIKSLSKDRVNEIVKEL